MKQKTYIVLIYLLILIVYLWTMPSFGLEISKPVRDAIRQASKLYTIPEVDLYSIAYVESTLNPNTKPRYNVNNTVDVGLFQINSKHWDTTCKEFNVFKLKGNVMCAAKLIKMHEKNATTDAYWIGRYHSKTPSKKRSYIKKLNEAKKILNK